MQEKARILLVDDHPLVLEWLGNLINQQADLETCGATGKSAQALQWIEKLAPDVAIVDISLADGSGIELIKNIKACAPQVQVIVLSMHDEALYAERAMRAGARGYIMKREATTKILQAVRSVLQGRLFLSPEVAMLMAERFVEGTAPGEISPVSSLSDRELEVFELLGRGVGTRKIAENLHVSVKTVQAFCARIKVKLGLASATELLREAIYYQERKTDSS